MSTPRGWTQLAPGVYSDEAGTLHLAMSEMLAAAGYADTAENRDTLQRAALQMAVTAGIAYQDADSPTGWTAPEGRPEEPIVTEAYVQRAQAAWEAKYPAPAGQAWSWSGRTGTFSLVAMPGYRLPERRRDDLSE